MRILIVLLLCMARISYAQIVTADIGSTYNYSNQLGGINGWLNTGRISYGDTTRATTCLDGNTYVTQNDGFGPNLVLGLNGQAVFLTTMGDFISPSLGVLQTLKNAMTDFGHSSEDIFHNQTSMKSAGISCQWDDDLGLEMMYWSVYQQWSANDPRHGYHVNLMMSRDHGTTWYGPYHTNHTTGAPTITPSATGDGPGVDDFEFDDSIKSIYPVDYCAGGRTCVTVDNNSVYKYGHAESELGEHIYAWRVLLGDLKKGLGSLFQWYKGPIPTTRAQAKAYFIDPANWGTVAQKVAIEPSYEAGGVAFASPVLYIPGLDSYVFVSVGMNAGPTLIGPFTRAHTMSDTEAGWWAPITKSLVVTGNTAMVNWIRARDPSTFLLGDPNNQYGALFHTVTFTGAALPGSDITVRSQTKLSSTTTVH